MLNKTVVISLSLSLYGSTALWTLVVFFSFLILYTVCRTPWTGDQPVKRPLPTHRTTQTQNKRTQTSMPRVGFEPTIPVFKRAKKVHAVDRVATVISCCSYLFIHSFIHHWLYNLLLGPGRFLSFVILYTVGRTPWTVDQPVSRPLPYTQDNTNRINAHKHSCL
jgi:hypothetical protein